MKLLTVALVFCSLVLIGHVTTGHMKENSCSSDIECMYAHGSYCFCLKVNDNHNGQCYCNMDPNFLNGCSIDADCNIGKPKGSIPQICDCRKNPHKCECVVNVLG